ncbi:hypothetical protein CPB84DRAFT_1854523 [Gymnopilus junonius]|uniref:Uncharacterized protein n=1 Tax=Gymnopilus junonius TaxID=109634 RepID=A0A9P5N8G9_GYMJU|nr:hypothetical protein CPB84DRAFT_1854523 [Gymnopilus junonius]
MFIDVPPPSCHSVHLTEHEAATAAEPPPETELPQEELWRQWGEATETAPDDDNGEEEHKRKEKGKEKKKEREKKKKEKKAEKKRNRKARRKTDMERATEDAAEDAKGAPPKLTLVEKQLADEGATIAPPEHPHREPTASSLPPLLSVSTTWPCAEHEPEVSKAAHRQDEAQADETDSEGSGNTSTSNSATGTIESSTSASTSDTDSNTDDDNGANDDDNDANNVVNANNAEGTRERCRNANNDANSTREPPCEVNDITSKQSCYQDQSGNCPNAVVFYNRQS